MEMINWADLEEVMEEISSGQRHKLLACGRALVPSLTEDDLYQPNDFPELESHPYFRYEEGVLEGILTVRMALAALRQEKAMVKGEEDRLEGIL